MDILRTLKEREMAIILKALGNPSYCVKSKAFILPKLAMKLKASGMQLLHLEEVHHCSYRVLISYLEVACIMYLVFKKGNSFDQGCHKELSLHQFETFFKLILDCKLERYNLFVDLRALKVKIFMPQTRALGYNFYSQCSNINKQLGVFPTTSFCRPAGAR